jgi:hypothetical protein
MEARGYRRVGQGHWVSPDRKFRWNGRSWLPIPRKERCWYGEGRRLAYGSVWSVYTLILLSFGIYAATQPLLGGGITFLALALASVTGAYAWVIWTWRAPILWFVIFF